MPSLYRVLIPTDADELAQLRAERLALHTALRALHLNDVEARPQESADDDRDPIVLYRCKRCGGYLNNGMDQHRDWCPYSVLGRD